MATVLPWHAAPVATAPDCVVLVMPLVSGGCVENWVVAEETVWAAVAGLEELLDC